jgi:hypothetical protein
MASFALFVIVLALYLWQVRGSIKRTEDQQTVWQEFARDRGLQWQELSGPWYRRRGGIAQGDIGGVTIILDKHFVSAGKVNILFTRLRAAIDPPVTDRLTLTRRTLAARLNFASRGPLMTTGDAGFDTQALVRCRSRELTLQVLNQPVRTAWASFPQRAELVCEGATATLCWRDIETDRIVLDAATELLLTITKACGTRAASGHG